MPGPQKKYVKKLRTPVTEKQERHLQFRAVGGNTSVAAVLRHLIDEDIRKEKDNGR